jgi:hypothetical protein
MRNLIIACALMFSAVTFAQMTFSIGETWDINTPLNFTGDVDETTGVAAPSANIGWFMTDDIMVSVGMASWDEFNVNARYYTGFCGNMFIQAGTTAGIKKDADGNDVLNADGTTDAEYDIGMRVGWTKALGIWKLQFEPMVVLDDIQAFEPRLAWAVRFNL